MMKVGFVGAGQMAQALAAGFASRKDSGIASFVAADPNEIAIADFTARVGQAKCLVVDSNNEVFQICDLVFIAVKPQYLDSALKEVDSHSAVVVSVAAGVTIARLAELTNTNSVIRVMPNTPCLIGEGAIAVASHSAVPADKFNHVESLLESVGTVKRVEEKDLDAVTALSGSGPAFVFRFLEAMISGAVKQGLDKKIATELAIQTVIGAGRLAQASPDDLETLRERVTSPGGTTLAGLNSMKENEFKAVVEKAIEAAAIRSIELGN